MSEDEAALKCLFAEQDSQEKSEGGSRAKSSSLRAGPCANYRDLKVFSSIQEEQPKIRLAESQEDVKQVQDKMKTTKSLFLALAKSVSVAMDDVRGAMTEADKHAKKLKEKAAKEEEEAAKRRRRDGGRPPAKLAEAYYNTDKITDVPVFTCLEEPNLQHPLILERVPVKLQKFLDESKTLTEDVADFAGHFKQSSMRLTSGRGQRRILDMSTSAQLCVEVAAFASQMGLQVGWKGDRDREFLCHIWLVGPHLLEASSVVNQATPQSPDPHPR